MPDLAGRRIAFQRNYAALDVLLARWATIIANAAGAENETLPEKAEQAGRESFGGS